MPTGSVALPSSLWGRVRTLLSVVRFSHTLFALPWAVAGLFVGARGWPDAKILLGVLGAMVGARTAAMAWNRLVDRRIDATNPRTASRPSVTGAVSPSAMSVLVVLGGALFIVAAYSLNPLCGHLAWPTLLVLLSYSLTKRFTSGSHFFLGFALGLSPVGAYLAARGAFDADALGVSMLGVAVLLWTAGFDILYACQDIEHDRREGLRSVPATFGLPGALWIARVVHMLVPIALTGAGLLLDLGWVYFGGCIVVAGLLAFEHRLVRADDLSRVGVAFFQMNIAIAVVMMVVTVVDVLRVAP